MSKQCILIVNVTRERVILILAYFRLGLFKERISAVETSDLQHGGERVQQFGEL